MVEASKQRSDQPDFLRVIVGPGQDIARGEPSVGARNVPAADGFREVGRPAFRRAVMRVDFEASGR